MQFSELVKNLSDSTVKGSSLTAYPDLNPKVTGVASVEEATLGTIAYIEGGKYAAMLETTGASALILPCDERLQQAAIARGIPWIAASDPKYLFASAVKLFYQPYRPQPGIHPTAIIDPTAMIGENCAIGARVFIDANVKIGNDVCILANVVIYPDVEIGDRTLLHANCTIHERTRIGADCIIQSSAVIGAEGFGFVPTSKGWIKMEQSGITVLEDGVEVGCGSAVDRPPVGETRIGRNTKIDNLVQIGHGCRVGAGCMMSAQVGLAGRAKIGDRVILAGQAGVGNDISIGDGAIASAKSGVMRDVPPGQTVSGFPAIAHRLWSKISVLQLRLPEIDRAIKKIEKSRE
ncbi:UDP-3-O-(3-hydroxymyristoyl)glucosamine N-acyltransferase [Oscillatoria sp. FACHB-1406]|uniref:UDP-3-O-(3-hydroxymyristoyl)glucosamine N-acyltransferase n=1 Tax=Oscillatoria sp. FACHB-1406 TaxID=2692846 RepID=UPI0016853810|nr:UDP-3-O-(3-hydroxymyristoyl)glucosamine N-acyltransferase [Oscillatoria sp. FACHB-1406]MBD2579548.1 UDP-3-O-(3-hydroxymyristoyl)glucosamine N-acyltransferase [Oscillatoria sp. FACHB-1406]